MFHDIKWVLIKLVKKIFIATNVVYPFIIIRALFNIHPTMFVFPPFQKLYSLGFILYALYLQKLIERII